MRYALALAEGVGGSRTPGTVEGGAVFKTAASPFLPT